MQKGAEIKSKKVPEEKIWHIVGRGGGRHGFQTDIDP
jgi:hypothetical protein